MAHVLLDDAPYREDQREASTVIHNSDTLFRMIRILYLSKGIKC